MKKIRRSNRKNNGDFSRLWCANTRKKWDNDEDEDGGQ
jgi:hypothetical protein